MLKVSPWKGVIRFGKRGKLNPWYIGPFKVLAKMGTVAYRLELPQQLSMVHNTFHVSNLKKCLSDKSLVISLDEIHIDDKLHFVEEPVEIMDREVKRLKHSLTLPDPYSVATQFGGITKYIIVIVDDYSRYTWTLFLRTKDETPEVIKDFLKMIQRNLQAQVIIVRTDRGTEFLNKTLHAYFKEEGIENQTSTPRTPEQNGVVKRRNHTLVEAARMMLSASKLPLLFWAEAIAIACYTQNRSLIIPR
ncbi:putative reverse transcriptase domain-containing protein [Tanacetum coccineum]